MKNLKRISLALAMLYSFLSFGQEITINGLVTSSDDGLAIPGVTVKIKGTQKGTATDFNGNYSIQAQKGDELLYSFIGFISQTIKVGNTSKINVILTADSNSLEEVVVIGYGTRKRSAITGAVTRIFSKNNSNNSSSNANNALQGRVAGVQISNSQQASPSISIRGAVSVKGNQQPLYIIDGVPYENTPEIDTKNIKSINLIKDNSSAAIYGSRAANGIVIIETKDEIYADLSEKELKTQLEIAKPEPIPSNEDYENFVENQFESPKDAPLSTFSIDVDNASYTNIRRFINNGQAIPKDAVRVEEMMNFFKYNYPQPKENQPFSINTEYSNCPWNTSHQLLKIGLQGKIIPTENLPASNLVFLIDVSGSMSSSNKLPLLKKSMKILVNELRKEDKVSIVVYAGAAGMVLAPTSGDQKRNIINALDNLNAGGSTAGGAGIELAYKTAVDNFIVGGNNRVILATDGDFNVGSTSNKDMETLIEEKRKTGVFLTCLGYGMGNYKDSKMETLADKGNGNYAYIDNIQEANRFLGKEFKGAMFAIAKDVKIQIEFNPKHVQAYRLIGYENRKLQAEDFKNDAIDAGELGSGHTVTALYEIIPTGTESAFSLPELKYTTTSNNTSAYSDELATIKFRYKKPDGDKSIEIVETINNKNNSLTNASADFKFTTSVAWFGLKLRDSKLISNKDNEAILALAEQGLEQDKGGYKAEFLRLVESVN